MLCVKLVYLRLKVAVLFVLRDVSVCARWWDGHVEHCPYDDANIVPEVLWEGINIYHWNNNERFML